MQSKLDEYLRAAAALPAEAVESEERRREAGRRRIARAAKQRLQDIEHVRCVEATTLDAGCHELTRQIQCRNNLGLISKKKHTP